MAQKNEALSCIYSEHCSKAVVHCMNGTEMTIYQMENIDER